MFVKAPLRVPIYKVLEFVESKKKWIYEKHNEQKSKFKKISFKKGDFLKILGKDYKLDIRVYEKKQAKLEPFEDKIIAYVPNNISEEEKENLIKIAYDKMIIKIANEIIPEEMNKICNLVGLKPKILKIRNFKRAWGNCSSKKVISINKDLCKFSIDAIDYVCLHEVCHLKYMNHSKDFWNMVESYMPNYKQIQKELK